MCVCVPDSLALHSFGDPSQTPGAFRFSLLIARGARLRHALNISSPFHLLDHLFADRNYRPRRTANGKVSSEKKGKSIRLGLVCGRTHWEVDAIWLSHVCFSSSLHSFQKEENASAFLKSFSRHREPLRWFRLSGCSHARTLISNFTESDRCNVISELQCTIH